MAHMAGGVGHLSGGTARSKSPEGNTPDTHGGLCVTRTAAGLFVLAGVLAACTPTTHVVLAPPLQTSASAAASPSPGTSVPAAAGGVVANPTPAASAPPECSTADLAVSLGPDNPGAGTNYLPVILRNAGPLPCTTGGFPGVSFVSNSGAQVGVSAKWVTTAQSPLRLVVLSPGQSASSLLSFVFAGNVPAKACRQAAATGLRIYPPNETAPRVLDFTQTICTTRTWRARVTPLEPGVTGLGAAR